MTDKKEPLTVRLNDDKTQATIRTTMVPLSAKEIEDAIGALATARSQMEPPIPMDLPSDHAVSRHQGASCFIAWDFLSGMPSISFRSPAFGWLKFMIPSEQVDTICQALVEAKQRSNEAKKIKPH